MNSILRDTLSLFRMYTALLLGSDSKLSWDIWGTARNASYNQIASSNGYYNRVPRQLVEYANPFWIRNTPILDIGCGTGEIGRSLRIRDIKTIDGIDFSSGMVSRIPPEVYRKIAMFNLKKLLNKSPDLPQSRYHNIISSGVYGESIRDDSYKGIFRLAEDNVTIAISGKDSACLDGIERTMEEEGLTIKRSNVSFAYLQSKLLGGGELINYRFLVATRGHKS